jgi:ankyrin repeat protein
MPLAAQTPPSAEEIAAYTDLHAAVVGGSAVEVEHLVREGANINARDGFGRTPLIVAAHRCDITVAKALIALGAGINALDHQSYDAMTVAAVNNDVEMLELLIASGGNVRARVGPHGGTALSAAARLGRADAVTVLLGAGAPAGHVDLLGSTALVDAIARGDDGPSYQATLAALIKAGADVNVPDATGTRPLTLARTRGHAELAKLLEAAGATP